MRQRLLAWYSGFIYEHRIPVLLGAAALTLLAVLACLRLELRTSREALSEGHRSPAETAYAEFIEEFGAPNELLVVVEPSGEHPPPAAEYRAFVEDLARRLEGTQLFPELFYRVDLETFERHGLHYLALDRLRRLVEGIESVLGSDPDLSGLRTAADLNRRLAGLLRSGLAGEGGGSGPPEGAEGLRRLAELLAWEARFLEDPGGVTAGLDLSALGRSLTSGRGLSPEGYLTSRSGRHYFLVARPGSSTSDLDYINPLIARVRAEMAGVEAEHPGLRAGLTGLPAMVQEEMAAVRRDTLRTTALAVLGIAALAMVAFHRRRLAPLVLVSLGMGVLWAGALISLSVGYLNLITSSFAAILIGLGIDFGVHIVSQYELEVAHGRGCRESIGEALRKTGPGLLASAFTTAAAFFSITLLDFPGFSQLGFIGGWGILLCLVATLTALPALLAIEGHRREMGATSSTSLRRGDRISRAVLRFPRTVLAAGAVVTLLVGLRVGEISFDSNIQNLLPMEAESLRIQETVLRESDLSPDFSMVMADDLDELGRLASRRPDLASIGRRESILTYLPLDAAERRPLLDRLERLLARVKLPPEAGASRPGGLRASLDELEGALAEVEELAFAEGRTGLLGAVGGTLEALEGAREAARGAPEPPFQARAEGWERLLATAREGRERLLELAGRAAPEPADLPETLRQRLIGRSGKYLLYLYPDDRLARTEARRRFIRESREISPAATGYPILIHEGTRRITAGFHLVIGVGALLTALALVVDFRHLGYAIMAAATTGLGIFWMLGLMGLRGIDFNLANLPTVPLVLGAGVAYGIHVLHRYRQEGTEGLATVLHHTGRAILISALTTMIGFGSMAFASHRGVASLGKILLFGIGSCFVCAAVLLPCALHLLSRREAGDT